MGVDSVAGTEVEPANPGPVESTPGRPAPGRRTVRALAVTTALLAFGLVIVLILATVPLVSVTRGGETWVSYEFTVGPPVDQEVSTQPVIFHGVCDTTQTTVGNQTGLISWATTNGLPVIWLEITLLRGGPALTLLANFTNTSSGGYALSSTHAFETFCGGPFEILADANPQLNVEVIGALFYNYSSEAPYL